MGFHGRVELEMFENSGLALCFLFFLVFLLAARGQVQLAVLEYSHKGSYTPHHTVASVMGVWVGAMGWSGGWVGWVIIMVTIVENLVILTAFVNNLSTCRQKGCHHFVNICV